VSEVQGGGEMRAGGLTVILGRTMMNPTPSAFLNAFTVGLLLGVVIGGLLASSYWTKLICGYLVREDEQVTAILGRGVECRACGQRYLDKEPCCPRCGVAG
jgi:hypothetical protein